MRFEFATATRIVFGTGAIAELPTLAATYGKRAFVVTGKDKIRHADTIANLEALGFHCALFGVPEEPTVDLIREGAQHLRDRGCTVVIAIGGGSVIDAGKAIAAIAANPGDVLNYLEVIGQSNPLSEMPVPFIAVPTTAGTGSEVTRNAVLGSPEHRVKASLRSASMLPKIALIDPELTFTLGRFATATTGLDALTQLIEPYVSSRANPITDAFCRDGLRMAPASLRQAFSNPKDAAARTRMSYASLLGGLALANAGLGVIHGFAAPIGGMFHAPHGAICAALLPHGMRANIAALKARAPESQSLARYEEIAALLTGNSAATAEEGADWIEALLHELHIPGLREYGMTPDHAPTLVEKAAKASSMKANPIVLTSDELTHTFIKGL